jgi:glycosyltransferase involved in cell wall biosynthesis
MKIAIDATSIQFPLTGIGFYVKKLLEAFATSREEHTFFLLHRTKEWSGPDFGKNFIPVSYRFGNATASSLFNLNKVLKEINADVFHAPATTGLPLQGTVCPSLVTLHDLFPLYPDLKFTLTKRTKFKTLFSWCCRNADAFLCNSNYTRNALLHYYPSVKEDKIAITYLAESCGNHRIEKESFKNIFLSIGGIERRKGQLFLLEAYKKAIEINRDLPKLLFAGEDRGDGCELRRKIKEYGISDKVEWRGYITEEEKYKLLNQTTLFLMPSLYEGFGIPLVDMMKMGVPFIASDIPVFREIVYNDASLCPYGDIEKWAEGILKFTDDTTLRKELIRKGNIHSEKFSWKKCSEETFAVYEKISQGCHL